MADKFTAAESIRRLAVMYQDMVAAADALEAIGKLEQTTAEADKARAAAVAEADKAKADLAKAKQKAKDAQEQAESVIAGANANAEAIIASAQRTAEENAAVIVKKAQDEAARLVAQAASEKARLSSELGGLQKAIVDAKGELKDIETEKATVAAEASQAEQKLEEVRSKIKALLG